MQTEELNGLSVLRGEVERRYGTSPRIPVEDVIFDNEKRIFILKTYSALNDNGYRLGKFEPKQSCRRCYGYGYTGIFEEMDKGKKIGEILKLCNCLKENDV